MYSFVVYFLVQNMNWNIVDLHRCTLFLFRWTIGGLFMHGIYGSLRKNFHFLGRSTEYIIMYYVFSGRSVKGNHLNRYVLPTLAHKYTK